MPKEIIQSIEKNICPKMSLAVKCIIKKRKSGQLEYLIARERLLTKYFVVIKESVIMTHSNIETVI